MYNEELESAVELKPCPFCGGRPEILERFIHGVANRKHYWIRCSKCWVGQDLHRDYRTREKAIERWNQRYSEES